MRNRLNKQLIAFISGFGILFLLAGYCKPAIIGNVPMYKTSGNK